MIVSISLNGAKHARAERLVTVDGRPFGYLRIGAPGEGDICIYLQDNTAQAFVDQLRAAVEKAAQIVAELPPPAEEWL